MGDFTATFPRLLLHDITAKLLLYADSHRLQTLVYGILFFPVYFPICSLWLFSITAFFLSLFIFAIGCSKCAPTGLWAPQLVPVVRTLPHTEMKTKLGLL